VLIQKEVKATKATSDMAPMRIEQDGWLGIAINTKISGDELRGVMTMEAKVARQLAGEWQIIADKLEDREKNWKVRLK